MPLAVADWTRATLAWVEDGYPTPQQVRAIFAEARRKEAAEAPHSQHEGVMVAFMVPPALAKRLAWQGGEPANELHVTLAYLGARDELSERERARLMRVVANYAEDREPVTITLRGVGSFEPSASSDGKRPIYLDVDSRALQRWRAGLVDAIKRAGLPLDETFKDYHPHITLKYAAHDERLRPPATFTEDLEGLAFVPRQVTVAVGGERTHFPVGEEQGYGDQGDQRRYADTQAGTQADTLNELRSYRALLMSALTE